MIERTSSLPCRTILPAAPQPRSAALLPPGAAGCAYALWHAHRHAAALESAASEADLLGSAERYARAALQGIAAQPPERYGWALLAGHAGVYCAGALVLSASAALARRQGRDAAAAQLQGEAAEAVRQFCALHRLACSATCEEDEASGWGGLMRMPCGFWVLSCAAVGAGEHLLLRLLLLSYLQLDVTVGEQLPHMQ